MNDILTDVLVIGSGMGGLTAALKLQQKGKKVMIVEQHSIPGGYCTNFKRKGFTFDSSIQRLPGCLPGGTIGDILNDLKIDTNDLFVELPELYTWKNSNISVLIEPDLKNFIHNISNAFPNEEKNIKKYFNRYVPLMKFMNAWARSTVLGKIILMLTKTKSLIDLLLHMNKTVKQVFKRYFIDDNVKDVLYSLAYFGLPAEKMSFCIYLAGSMPLLIEGAHYPKGGSGSLSKKLSKVFVERGGELLLHTEAVKISQRKKRISHITVHNKLENEMYKICPKWVVCNSDLTSLVEIVNSTCNIYKKYKSNIKQRKAEISALTFFLGLSIDLKDLGIMNTGVWNSRIQEESVVKSPVDPILNPDPLLYPHFYYTIYSNFDSSLAPIGKSNITAFFYAKRDMFDKAIKDDGNRKGKSYTFLKKDLANNFITALSNDLNIADLKKYVEVIEVGTPISNIHFTKNHNGSCFGWDMVPGQMMDNQMTQVTPFKNLFLAGQWTFPGGGVPTVMVSGINAANMVPV